jgi:hypothetical protein
MAAWDQISFPIVGVTENNFCENSALTVSPTSIMCSCNIDFSKTSLPKLTAGCSAAGLKVGLPYCYFNTMNSYKREFLLQVGMHVLSRLIIYHRFTDGRSLVLHMFVCPCVRASVRLHLFHLDAMNGLF